MADTIVTAADTTIFNSRGLWGPYWVSPLIGCIIYVDANVDVAARKTTDGGATWGAAVVLEAELCDQMQAVFDRQVVGDTGDKVHIAYVSGTSDTLRYSNYDISANAWAGVVSTAHNASGTDNSNKVFITKTKSGNILCGAVNSGVASIAVKLASPWSSMSAITSPYEANANDATLGGVYVSGTGDDNDGGIFFWDTSANAISVKLYDDSGNSWTETAIASGFTLNTTYHGWSCAVRHSDGVNVLVAWTDTDPATAVADLKVYTVLANSIAAPTLANLTDVVTNVTENAQVDVFINQSNDDIYVSYLIGGTFTSTVDVKYRLSTDDASTWSGAAQTVSEDAADDNRLLGSSHMAAADGGRFQPVWFNDDLNNNYNNLNTDVEIPALVIRPRAVNIRQAVPRAAVR